MRRAARCLMAVLLMTAGSAAAADLPVRGNLIRFRDPGPVSKRRFFFRTVKESNVSLATIGNPIVDGATLHVFGSGVGDGDTGVILLPAENWVPLNNGGYYYRDQAAASGGVSQVRIRPRGPLGGSIHISAHGTNWAYSLSQPQGTVRVQLTIGGDVFCARFSDLQPNLATRVQGKSNPAPGDCS